MPVTLNGAYRGHLYIQNNGKFVIYIREMPHNINYIKSINKLKCFDWFV